MSPPLAVATAALALAVWTALALAGHRPFEGWYYQLAWYSVLVLLDAGLAWREGRYPLLGRPRFALSLLLWSVPVWLFYELLNFRLANWYYVNVTPDPLVRRIGTVTAFATVLPALYLGHRWMISLKLARRWRGPGFRVRPWHLAGLFAGGVTFLTLLLWRPTTFYPLVWGSMTLLLEPWNWHRNPAGSLFGDLSRGEYGRIARLLAGGLAIGLVWELLNAPAATRWIYTVPGLESGKLFEMPLPGFLGFPVFALDCFVIYRALVNLGVAVPGWRGAAELRERAEESPQPIRGRVAAAALSAAAFSFAVMLGMDRYTVDSHAPALRELPGVGVGQATALRGAGLDRVRRVAESEPERISGATGLDLEAAREVREAARIASLRGIGTANAAALRAGGIRTVCELAAADWSQASTAVRALRDDPYAGRPARVRVWIRAAEDACRDQASPFGFGARFSAEEGNG